MGGGQVMAGPEGLLMCLSGGSCRQGSRWLGKEQERDNNTYVQTVTGDTVCGQAPGDLELSWGAADTVQLRDSRGRS